MEPLTGIEPVNLFLTKEALYRLSYSGIRTRLTYSIEPGLYLPYIDTNNLKPQFSVIRRSGNWKPGKNGAGEGNRTLVIILEGWSFTTKLHPLKLPRIHLKQNFLYSALTITGSPPQRRKNMVGRSGFEPLKAKADGVTVRSLWPLGHLPSHQQ